MKKLIVTILFLLTANVISAKNNPSLLTIPDVPVATAATSIAQTSFTVNWNVANLASGYYLDVATDESFTNKLSSYNNLDVGNSTSYNVIIGLTANATYYYRVRAYSISPTAFIVDGVSGNSNTMNLTTLPYVPSIPAATSASAVSHNSFRANWDAANYAFGYYIDVATDELFTNILINYNNLDVGNVITFNVTFGLSAYTTYYYRVRAYNIVGTSASSNTIQLTTLLNAPLAIAASSVSQTSFDANWNLVNQATGYYMDVATDAAFTNILNDYNNLNVGNYTSCTVWKGVTENTTYYYRIRAYKANTFSQYSNAIGVTTLIPLPDQPTSLTAVSITQSSFTAMWLAANNATGYFLDVATDRAFDNILESYNNRFVGTSTSIKVYPGLDAVTTFYYRVRAHNAGGDSPNSNVIEVKTVASNYTISGNAGIGNATISYTDGTAKTATADASGNYTLTVSNGWSGTVTPSLAGYTFSPASRTYTNTSSDQTAQNFNAVITTLTLTITSNNGTVTKNPNQTTYNSGAQIQLTATPAMGFKFVNWTEDGIPISTSSTITLIINSNRTLVANFKAIRGDVNSDGAIEAQDASLVLRAAVGNLTLTESQQYAADVNRDGSVGALDASYILYYVPGHQWPNGFTYIPKTVANAGIEFGKLSGDEKSKIISLPINLINSDEVKSVYAEINLGTNLNFQSVSSPLPDGWLCTSNYENGILKIAMAGLEPLRNGTVATINMKLNANEVTETINGNVLINDKISSQLKTVQIRELPKTFSLDQNYPNPFNPSTTIKYSVAHDGYVTLKIFDSLGKEIMTLVDEEKSSGNYEVKFDNKILSTGIYFYTMKSGNFTQTRKMILLK